MVRILTPLVALGAAIVALAATSQAQAGDAASGKRVFSAQCSTCHAAARGAAPILGPTLFGVVDRPVASVKGFAYSPAMKAAGGTWGHERLETYLRGPTKLVPGTKMAFGGLKSPDQLEDLLAYLQTLK